MTIEEIKGQLKMSAVLAHYQIRIQNNHVCCPFHDDKKPSMKVFRDSDTVHCFSGNCRMSGQSIDVIDFVMEKEQVSKHEAILKCKELLGWVAPVKPTGKILPKIWKSLEDTYKRSRSKVKGYVQDRGLNELSELGYHNGRWHERKEVSEREVELAKGANFLLPALQDPNKILPWAKNCLIFPLKNKAGEVVSFYGRAVGGRGHYYLKGGTQGGLYPQYPTDEATKVIVVESVIDAASLLLIPEITEGYELLAAYGTNGFTADHRQALATLPDLEEVVILFDGDAAGAKGSSKLVDDLVPYLSHATIKVAELPEGTDVNELWANHLSADLFLEVLSEAKTVYDPDKRQLLVEHSAQPLSSLSISNEYLPSADVKVKLRLEILRSNLYVYQSEGLKFEVLGGINLKGIAAMKCTVKVSRLPVGSSSDKVRHKLDLYHGGQVKGFEKHLHEQLHISFTEAKRAVSELIEQLETYRELWQEEQQSAKIDGRKLSTQRRKAALKYLNETNLMERTWDDLGKVGIVGERASAMIMYLCYSSRKLSKPLHVISFGTSGSGKTHLQKAVSSLIPKSDIVTVTSLSDRVLYYYGEEELKHKVFALEDLDGIGEDAMYALRELMSDGKLSRDIAQQNHMGKIVKDSTNVEGPICFSGCTTKENVYEDNANRCLLLYRDESPAHKAAVMDYQRKAAAGKVDILTQNEVKEQFKDQQTQLRAIQVVNPYAEALALPQQVFKPLRTNAHYLKFIEVITFYHQHQRAIKTSRSGTEYIETTIEDIEWANKLMKEVLLDKADELEKGPRQFLEKLKVWMQTNNLEVFKSRDLIRPFRMNYNTLKAYLYQLYNRDRIKQVGGSRYTGFEYQLVDPEEYTLLQTSVQTVLDETLARLKKQNRVGMSV